MVSAASSNVSSTLDLVFVSNSLPPFWAILSVVAPLTFCYWTLLARLQERLLHSPYLVE
jgi:hypothetical protein